MNIEELLDPTNIEKFKKAMSVIQKVQANIALLKGNGESDKTNIIKAGTTLTAAILQKVEKGWVSWDDKLDPTTITTSGELGIELSQALIDPDTFMDEMDYSIEENAGAYFSEEE